MKTLKFNKDNFFKNILLVVFCLLLIVLLLELALRVKPIQRFLSVPYLGSTHRQLETQFARIENYQKSVGKIDCIFIGSSMVWLGIDPPVFSNSFYRSTGEEWECFNFGVSTMPANAAGVITEILVKKYQPRVILFGTSARDYAIPAVAEDSSVIVNTAYVQFQTGHPSFQGWLYTSSFFYRNIRNLNRLLKFDRTVFTDIGTSEYDRTGFLPKMGKVGEENIQAGIQDAQKWLENYQVLEENVTGLKKIAEFSNHNIQVIFFETPVLDQYYDYFSNGEEDFENFAEVVSKVSEDYEIPFIRTKQQTFIPVEGWWNENHLNLTGADALSWWLGEQVGLLANNNKLSHFSIENINTSHP
jgi:hypothetical protein